MTLATDTEVLLERVKKNVAAKLGAEWTSHGTLRRAVGYASRQYFEEAVDQLTAEGVVEHESRAYHGQVNHFYRATTPGRARSTAEYWAARARAAWLRVHDYEAALPEDEWPEYLARSRDNNILRPHDLSERDASPGHELTWEERACEMSFRRGAARAAHFMILHIAAGGDPAEYERVLDAWRSCGEAEGYTCDIPPAPQGYRDEPADAWYLRGDGPHDD